MFQHYDLSYDNLYNAFLFSLESSKVSKLILSYCFVVLKDCLWPLFHEIPSSQTKVTSLCCYIVSLFIHAIATCIYGCNQILKTIVKKLYVVLC
jgi:hypothetical protein